MVLNYNVVHLLTRNNIIKYWELSIGMCQSSSMMNMMRAMVYEGLSGVSSKLI